MDEKESDFSDEPNLKLGVQNELDLWVKRHFQDTMHSEYGKGLALQYSNVAVPASLEKFCVCHVICSNDVLNFEEGRCCLVGIIQVDIFSPKDEPASTGQSMARYIARCFRRTRFKIPSLGGSIVFKTPTIQNRGIHRNRLKHMMWVGFRLEFKDGLLEFSPKMSIQKAQKPWPYVWVSDVSAHGSK